jgi:hypothetical protein
MLAVLQDAFSCYQKYMLASDRTGSELFEEAVAWIECRSTDGLFSFESITEALDIEPEYFRRGLAAWRKRQLEKPPVDPADVAPPPQVQELQVQALQAEDLSANPPLRRGAARR